MRYFFSSTKVLAADFASTILFLVLFETTGSTKIAAALGLGLGIGQMVWKLYRRESIDALQWISLVLTVVSASAAVITGSPRYVMAKPSVIYVLVGVVMLKPGWMIRYVPPIVQDNVPELVTRFGYVWAGLMFASAVLNLVLALRLDVTAWAVAMSVWGLASKGGLFVTQFFVIRTAVIRKLRGGPAQAVAA